CVFRRGLQALALAQAIPGTERRDYSADRVSGRHITQLLKERQNIVQIAIADECFFCVRASVCRILFVCQLGLVNERAVTLKTDEPGGRDASSKQRDQR